MKRTTRRTLAVGLTAALTLVPLAGPSAPVAAAGPSETALAQALERLGVAEVPPAFAERLEMLLDQAIALGAVDRLAPGADDRAAMVERGRRAAAAWGASAADLASEMRACREALFTSTPRTGGAAPCARDMVEELRARRTARAEARTAEMRAAAEALPEPARSRVLATLDRVSPRSDAAGQRP